MNAIAVRSGFFSVCPSAFLLLFKIDRAVRLKSAGIVCQTWFAADSFPENSRGGFRMQSRSKEKSALKKSFPDIIRSLPSFKRANSRLSGRMPPLRFSFSLSAFFFENVCKGTIAPCRWAETGDFFHFASEKEGVCLSDSFPLDRKCLVYGKERRRWRFHRPERGNP